jgi:hypothetical protein
MSNPYNQPFPVTLAFIRKGALVNELTEKLAEVVAGVMQFEKPGELVLKLKVIRENDEMVFLKDEVAVKVPEADRTPTWMFATEDGGLARKPTDEELPLIRQIRENTAEEK